MSTELHRQTNVQTFDQRDAQVEYEWQSRRIEKVCQILRSLPARQMVADVGCCSGLATPSYASCEVGTIEGFDISEASLEALRAKGFKGYFWNVDGEVCPRPAATYDVVIAGEIIEHLLDTDHFIQEVYRILKPGGYLILTTPNLAAWYNRWRLLRGLVPLSYPGVSSRTQRDPMIDRNHIRVNLLSEWQNLVEQHGFRLVQVQGSSHLQVWQGGWRTRLLKWLDRQFERRPTLAINLVMLYQR